MNKIDKFLLIYIGIFFIFLIFTIPLTTIHADEGTHCLLALFYKDMFTAVLGNLNLSFQRLYDFGISYLTHYPKLQVFYPPLYHLITGFIFYPILGVSIISARLANVIMTILTVTVFYFVTRQFFNRKVSFIATILFSLFPVTLEIGRMAMMEFTAFFFILVSLYFYQKAWKTHKYSHYILTSITVFLAIISKRPAFLLVFVYSLHILYRKKWRKLIFFLIPLLLLVPYLLILERINGFEISSIIHSKYAFYVIDWEYPFKFPFLFVLFFLFFYHNYKKMGEKEKLFVLWFFIFFIGILFLSFKEKSYVYFLIPVFMVSGNYLYKIKKRWLCIFLVGYFILSLFITVRDWRNYPQIEKISYEIYSNLPKEANVAMFSESSNRYSSAFMFHLGSLDKDKNLFFYRPCKFYNKTREEILDLIEKNNVYHIIAIPGKVGYENVNKIEDKLRLVEDGPIELYEVKEFIPKQKEYCNYVCLTEEKICTEYKNPFSVFES